MDGAAGKRFGSLPVFFLRFLAFSTLLYLIHLKAGFIYMRAVAWGASPLLAIFGKKLVLENALKVTEEISLNPVVYLSLVAAVTGVSWKKRIRPAVAGYLILTAANILTVFLVFMSAYMKDERLWAGTEFLNLTINFFLPLLLWFVLMPIRDIFPFRNS
jgi:hypothetical protein